MTTSPITPVAMNTSAMPRSGPVPNHGPIHRAPAPSVMNGIMTNCVSGATRNAVRGDAACSTLCANPKTRPCRS